MGETYIEASVREIREEVGLDIELLRPDRPDFVREMIQPDQYHFIILTSAAVPSNNIIHKDKE